MVIYRGDRLKLNFLERNIMWDYILLGLCIVGAIYGIVVNLNITKEEHWEND